MGLPAVSWLRLSPKAGWKLLPSVPFTVYYAYVADRHTKLKWRWQSVPSLRCELKGPEGQGWVSPLSPAVCRWLLQPCWAHDSSASGPGRWRLWRWHQLWLLPCSPACSAETGLSPFLRAFQVHKDPCPAAALPTSSVWERLCWLLSYWAPQAAVPQCGAVAVQVCSPWLCLPAQVATAGLSWLAADPEVLQSLTAMGLSSIWPSPPCLSSVFFLFPSLGSIPTPADTLPTSALARLHWHWENPACVPGEIRSASTSSPLCCAQTLSSQQKPIHLHIRGFYMNLF